MIGVCCSGKTVFVKSNLLPSHQYISEKAMTKGMIKENLTSAENLPILYACMAIATRALMIQELPVVIDDRNLSVESLVVWKKIAKEHGYEVIGILMDTPLEECRKRMAKFVDYPDATQELFNQFEALEDMKPMLLSKYHKHDLFDNLKIINWRKKE